MACMGLQKPINPELALVYGAEVNFGATSLFTQLNPN